ncbi:P-loop containing nucleoside triphosphate hydrolase protein [Immersiella caudata]|uniref:RNA helicase n=1 Tax=Immersiella caudata TaxID=314043 RepID=A0AA40C315_9PEZI|nr:P-loop containing nucleoside triphosphate hydrolase protein [Immersiella caudata]
MWKTARDSVCLICRSAGAPGWASSGTSLPWVNQQSARTFATRRERRATPSRMILSDRVDRPPPPRGNDAPKKPRNKPAGPFSGMNRTVANIPAARRVIARTRDLTPTSVTSPAAGDKERDKEREKKKGKRTFKAMNMQRSLTTIGYGLRTVLKEKIAQVESFDQFELLPSIKEALAKDALKGMVDIKPTPVQKLAIPALLGQRMGPKMRRRAKAEEEGEVKRKEFLLAAETGSGKTLAYLLPAIDALKKAEAEDTALHSYLERLEKEKEIRGDQPLAEWIEKFEPNPNTARPRVVVLVPTAELVDQVTRVAKSISHVVKFKARPLSANLDPLKIRNNLYSPMGVDMIIATPHLLASIAESDPYILSRVSHLVIDEADSLLDRSFAPETTAIVDRAMPTLRQLVLCSATIPKRLDNYLAEGFPDITRITTPNLHAIPRRVQLGVIDVSRDPYRNNKNLACADAIYSIAKDSSRHDVAPGEVDVKRIMVFVNERETTKEVADYLISKGIDAVALHRDSPELRQSEMLATFTTSEPMRVAKALFEGDGHDNTPTRRRLPNTKVIVATDLASRGIDTLAVRHVVLYDVPHTSIDFIHRLGRAGRMGRRGRGVVLLGRGDRRDIVAEVKESMFMGQALV